MCIRVSTIINGNLKLYNEGGGLNSLGTPSLAVPLEAKHGNATWLALSSSVCFLCLSSFWRTLIRVDPPPDRYHLVRRQDLWKTSTSRAGSVQLTSRKALCG